MRRGRGISSRGTAATTFSPGGAATTSSTAVPERDTLDGGLGGDDLNGGDQTDTVTYATRERGGDGRPRRRGRRRPERGGRRGRLGRRERHGRLRRRLADGQRAPNTLVGNAGNDTLNGADARRHSRPGRRTRRHERRQRRPTASSIPLAPSVSPSTSTARPTTASPASRTTPAADVEDITGGSGQRHAHGERVGEQHLRGRGQRRRRRPRGRRQPERRSRQRHPAPGQRRRRRGHPERRADLDTIDYSERTNAVTISATGTAFSGEAGENDVLNDNPERLLGGAGNDTIVGATAANTLLGGAGDDSLNGGPGNDVLDGGTGSDAMAGGGNVDTVDYAARTAPLYVNLEGIANDGVAGERDNVAADVTLVNAGSGNDHLVGSAIQNIFSAGLGNDRLNGAGGNDTLRGEGGDDLIEADAGKDDLVGGAGHGHGRLLGSHRDAHDRPRRRGRRRRRPERQRRLRRRDGRGRQRARRHGERPRRLGRRPADRERGREPPPRRRWGRPAPRPRRRRHAHEPRHRRGHDDRLRRGHGREPLGRARHRPARLRDGDGADVPASGQHHAALGLGHAAGRADPHCIAGRLLRLRPGRDDVPVAPLRRRGRELLAGRGRDGDDLRAERGRRRLDHARLGHGLERGRDGLRQLRGDGSRAGRRPPLGLGRGRGRGGRRHRDDHRQPHRHALGRLSPADLRDLRDRGRDGDVAGRLLADERDADVRGRARRPRRSASR